MCVTHMGSCTWNRPALLWFHSALVSQKMAMFFRGFCPRAARPLPKALTSLYTWSYDIQRYCPKITYRETQRVWNGLFSVKLLFKERDHRSPVQCFLSLFSFHWMRLYNFIDQQLLLLVHYIVTIHGELTGIIFYILFTFFTFCFLLLSHKTLAKFFFYIYIQLWKWYNYTDL